MGKKSFTLKSDKPLNALITNCGICEAYDPNVTMQSPRVENFSALWDTGATHSVINKVAADKLGLIPIGQALVYHANGECIVNKYLVNIFLPNGIMAYTVPVTEGKLKGFDMLIGMDIINLGDFSITHKDNGTTFSFQIPATHNFDFVEENKSENK